MQELLVDGVSLVVDLSGMVNLSVFNKNDIGSHLAVFAGRVVDRFPHKLINSVVSESNIVVFIIFGDACKFGEHDFGSLEVTSRETIGSGTENNKPGLVTLLVSGDVLVPVLNV